MPNESHHNAEIIPALSFLGKMVTVTIDRPLGSAHPNYPTAIYPINYGYLEGVLAPDGEELDVYVLGADTPLRTFTGQVIGVIHRENDIEDKLVAAPVGSIYSQNEILEQVHFQEQYFIHTVDCLYRKSAGAIVYRRPAKDIVYLLLFQSESQTWSFPKGHMEAFETEQETVNREIHEETGLALSLHPEFREEIAYTISSGARKTVALYLAAIPNSISPNEELRIRPDEIEEYRFVGKGEACALLKHPEYHTILTKAEQTILQESCEPTGIPLY